MNNPRGWELDFQTEIQTALEARQRGNEGKARVCARRAAGIVASQFFLREGLPDPSSSALERLKRLRELQDLPSGVSQAIEHFIVRITPEHRMPIDSDLVAEAVWLRKALIDESNSD